MNEKEENKISNFSATSLNLYKKCPRKFYYSYINKLPRKNWDHNDIGTLVHKTLEFFHTEYIESKSIVGLMGDCFKRARDNFIKKEKRKLKSDILLDAKRVLQDYIYIMEQQGVPGIYKKGIIDIERRFSFKVSDKFNIVGAIDRIDKCGNLYSIWDYKTSKSVKYMEPLQLQIYSMSLFDSDSNIKEVNGGYIMLRLNARPIIYHFIKNEIAAIKDRLLEVCEEINKDTEWEKKPSQLCGWCDFCIVHGGPCPGKRKNNAQDDWD